MKKYKFIILTLFVIMLIISCDPLMSIDYVITNNLNDSLSVKVFDTRYMFHGQVDSVWIRKIPPHETVTLIEEGYITGCNAKAQYEDSIPGIYHIYLLDVDSQVSSVDYSDMSNWMFKSRVYHGTYELNVDTSLISK